MVTMSHDVVISMLFCNILQVLFDLHQTGNVAEHRTNIQKQTSIGSYRLWTATRLVVKQINTIWWKKKVDSHHLKK